MSNHKTTPMKKLLITLSILPFVALAQDAEQADDVTPTFYKNEIGISTGVHLNIIDDDLYPGSLGTRVSLGYLRNIDRVQIGLVAEAGSEDGLYRYISPVLMFNYRIPVGKSYGYIGMAGGYYLQQYTSYGWGPEYRNKGYTMGMQLGYVWNFSRHFSFTSELSLRSSQFWYENAYFVSTSQPYTLEPDGYYVRYRDKFFELYLPIAFGMRYRF
jgi:hypothetical protein